MRRNINYKNIAAILTILFMFIIVPFIYLQSEYLSLQIFDVPITKIELAVYEDKPFESEIVSLKTLDGGNAAIAELKHEMDMESIQFFHPSNSSEVLFIYYAKGNVINAYVGKNKIGLNYGKIWLRVRKLDKIINEFK